MALLKRSFSPIDVCATDHSNLKNKKDAVNGDCNCWYLFSKSFTAKRKKQTLSKKENSELREVIFVCFLIRSVWFISFCFV